MITERTLRKWRGEALLIKRDLRAEFAAGPIPVLCNYILKMTQELLDQHLLRKEK